MSILSGPNANPAGMGLVEISQGKGYGVTVKLSTQLNVTLELDHEEAVAIGDFFACLSKANIHEIMEPEGFYKDTVLKVHEVTDVIYQALTEARIGVS